MPIMFERFTDRARRVLVIAQEEARVLEHNFLGTEHVLLGLIKEGEGVGAKALEGLGTNYATLRGRITAVITPGAPGTASGAPPFTPRAKKVLELALTEALELGHNYIGTEHLLLGLIREGEGVASQVLIAEGLALPKVRAKVIELLAGYQAQHQPVGLRTPAATALPEKAKAWAGVNPVGSQHYLLALLEDPNCLAARVLSSLGVTLDAAGARIREIGVAGTSDEVLPPAPRPSTGKPAATFTFGDHVTLSVDDPAMAATIVKALQESGAAATAEERSAAVGSIVASIVSDAVGADGGASAGDADAGAEEPPEEDAAPPSSE